MPKTKLKRPTNAEVLILKVLWKRGPSTVREVYEALGPDTGYTTILKMMQLMAAKGLLLRDESERTHTYRPAQPAEQTQRRLIRDLMDRAFNGSALQLVMQALSSKKTSARELAEIRKLLDQIERGEK